MTQVEIHARGQAIRIHGIREAQVENICIDAEAVVSCVRAERCDPLNLFKHFIETEVHIRIDSPQTDLTGKKSYPTRHPQIEMPLVVGDGWWRRRNFFQLQF